MYEYDNNWLAAQGHGERIGAHRGLQAGLNHGYGEGYAQGWDECALAAQVQYDRLAERTRHLESLLAEARDQNADLRASYTSAIQAQGKWKEAFYSLLTVAEPALDLLANQSDMRDKIVFGAIKKSRALEAKGMDIDLVSENEIIKITSPKIANSFGNWFGRLLEIANRSEKTTPNRPSKG